MVPPLILRSSSSLTFPRMKKLSQWTAPPPRSSFCLWTDYSPTKGTPHPLAPPPARPEVLTEYVREREERIKAGPGR